MSLSQLPQAVMSTDVEVLVEGIILSALRGVKVFVTAGVKESFSELFRELGIELKEYSDALPETCIVIRDSQQRIIVEVYDGGKKANVVSMTPKKFAKVIETYLRKRKGDAQQVHFFEMVIPKDFAKLLSLVHREGSKEGEDEG